MSRWRALVLSLAAATWVPGASTAQVPTVPDGERVEGIAAIIGDGTPGAGATLILHSDVELRARIRLTGRAKSRVATGPLPRALLGSVLDELIGEALIAREAERVRLASPSTADVEREARAIAALAGGSDRLSALLEATGASRREVRAIAERRALARVFLEANLEGATTVTEGDVERAYEAGGHPFEGQPLEDVREELRGWIAQAVLRRAVDRWVTVLRSRTEVQVLARYASSEAERGSRDPRPRGGEPGPARSGGRRSTTQ